MSNDQSLRAAFEQYVEELKSEVAHCSENEKNLGRDRTYDQIRWRRRAIRSIEGRLAEPEKYVEAGK